MCTIIQIQYRIIKWAGREQSVELLATGWRVRRSIPGRAICSRTALVPT